MTDIVDVLRLPGNYKISTAPGGKITLDVGTQPDKTLRGSVEITGDLTVLGDTTYVQSTDLQVKDNIIILNQGASFGGKISSGGGTSGIVIDRGDPNFNGKLYLDDTPAGGTWLGLSNGTRSGIWHFKNDGAATVISAAGIILDNQGIESENAIAGTPRLVLKGPSIGAPAFVVNVDFAGYEDYVTDDNDIPNKKYVDDIIATTGVATATYANILLDVDPAPVIPPSIDGRPRTFITAAPSTGGSSGKISMFIDDYLTLDIGADNVQLAGVSIAGSTIQPFFTATNIYLTTDGAEVVVNSALTYQAVTTTPTASPNQVKVYTTGTAGAGGTGLMFVNPDVEDELVSSRRMMIYSIIF